MYILWVLFLFCFTLTFIHTRSIFSKNLALLSTNNILKVFLLKTKVGYLHFFQVCNIYKSNNIHKINQSLQILPVLPARASTAERLSPSPSLLGSGHHPLSVACCDHRVLHFSALQMGLELALPSM